MRQINMDLYLKTIKMRYLQGTRKTKTKLLNELCATGNYHCKHAIRILTGKLQGYIRKSAGRKKTYQPQDLLEPLKKIWLATDQMCGKRLKVALSLWLPHYESSYGILQNETKQQLLQMSKSTIDRLLAPCRSHYPKRLSGTKPGNLLRHQIPIQTDQWSEDKPGYVEADTVAHCGTSLLGNFIWSITLTDIFSGWTENRATWNKGAHGVFEQLKSIELLLPFLILGFDSDNGGEFINHHLINYFKSRHQPVQFTRSRPYHSGDNAHVEQKNWTHVRQIFGYYRLENPCLVDLMNDLYKNELSLLHNYFYPSMKIKDKVRIQSKMKKTYNEPRTPYQRLLESEHVSKDQKEKLQNTFLTLNPFELRENIEKKLKKIFSYVDLQLKKKTGTI